MISAAELSALLQVIVVDLVLAGDNAIVVGLVAAGLPAKDRARVIAIGIVAATLMRVGFAAVTVQLLQIVGLLLAGGLVLLWVAWKLWREIRARRKSHHPPDSAAGAPEKNDICPRRSEPAQWGNDALDAHRSVSLGEKSCCVRSAGLPVIWLQATFPPAPPPPAAPRLG